MALVSPMEPHPNVTAQLAGRDASRQAAVENDEGFFSEFGDYVDERIPRLVAGMVLGAAVTLFLLRVAGFRFSFGAQIGGGGGG